MKKVYVYGHFSSANHGNEALIRGLKNVLTGYDLEVFTLDKESDRKFELDKICFLKDMKRELPRYSLRNIFGYALYLLSGSDYFRYKIELKTVFEKSENKIFILEMGDQYCEGREVLDMYHFLNREIHLRGGRTIGLGCSINENVFKNHKVLADLQKYDLMIARESLTLDLLKKNGISNCLLAPDVAFAMQAVEEPDKLDCIKSDKQYIGIVVGGVAQGNTNRYKILIKGVDNLIEHIIGSSEYEILMIPHVNAGSYLNDLDTEKRLYEKYKVSNRVFLIEEMRADKIRYIISKCALVVTLRTHASIAAYASFVPVLVLGYSIKSRGIAKDIFGEYEPYIVDIFSEDFCREIIEKFDWMERNCLEVRKYLRSRMPEYLKGLDIVKTKVEELYIEE